MKEVYSTRLNSAVYRGTSIEVDKYLAALMKPDNHANQWYKVGEEYHLIVQGTGQVLQKLGVRPAKYGKSIDWWRNMSDEMKANFPKPTTLDDILAYYEDPAEFITPPCNHYDMG